MLAEQEIQSLKEIVFNPYLNSRTIKRLKTTWEEFINQGDVHYYDTHRDVNYSVSHTQYDKHEKYDRN
jgi:hypothetical protein